VFIAQKNDFAPPIGHTCCWDAASSQSTKALFLVGAVFLLPVILMYNGWSYWVFRGKVRGDLGYH
jgi:cytochrome d ubiquinol oxidase subunit II